ncbi:MULTISPECIES: hypothetical protein [unclassified Marinobacter]|uniref:hypothetical protein n=1 Tax=unclassified Marinobacter TaxID=83889 RepID=UPI0019056E0E|nr:hypothetical protein [Marinobacter sp. 1-3A]MBK1875176.1 hypothetical protein [Marinobacter sp. 1-3A]
MSRLVAALTFSTLSLGVSADLNPIADEHLSEVIGQAFISIDRDYHPDASTAYTRINLGMDIEVQTNIDTLELGRYERDGEKPGTSDVLINNFALGYIQNDKFFQDNPEVPEMYKADGTAYAENEVVPFFIENPFIEFAFDQQTQEVIGVRLGFGDAMGILSADIETLTGNVNVMIKDVGGAMKNAKQENPTISDQLIHFLTPILEKNNALETKARLVDGDPNSPTYGEIDEIRSEHIGVPDGERFVLEGASTFARLFMKDLLAPGSSSKIEVPGCNNLFDCPEGNIEVIAMDCKVLSIQSCFDLGQYRSFAVGELGQTNGERSVVAPVAGAFMSFQTRAVEWVKDVKQGKMTEAEFLQATSGAFFNIPNGATEVNLGEALNGVPRYRSEYIDRGRGLF